MLSSKTQARPSTHSRVSAPTRMTDHRPNRAQVIQTADVFVDAGGLIYSTDYNGGLYILEFNG